MLGAVHSPAMSGLDTMKAGEDTFFQSHRIAIISSLAEDQDSGKFHARDGDGHSAYR